MIIEKNAMIDLGDEAQILGIEVTRNKEAGTIEVNQDKYILSVLERFNMSDYNLVHTPGTGNELKSQLEGSAPLDEQATKLHQAMVGSLLFLTQCTRFDIAFSTMKSAPHMAKPTAVDMTGVKKILRYLHCLLYTSDAADE